MEPLATVEQPVRGAYTLAEVAGMMRCSTSHLRHLYQRGELPGAFRFGRSVRVSAQVLDRFLADPAAFEAEQCSHGVRPKAALLPTATVVATSIPGDPDSVGQS